MERVLEPEVMDSLEEALAYDAMDFSTVNQAFADDALALAPAQGTMLDAGTGTGRIPMRIAQQAKTWKIIGVDLSANMLRVGIQNLSEAGLQTQVSLVMGDVKQLPYPDGRFEMVISNSLIHHLPDPLPFLRELKRILHPQGAILLRDLLRPDNPETLARIVNAVGSDYDPHQRQLFEDSLQAAFTLEEIQDLINAAGLSGVHVYQSSDRHWTASRAWAGR